MPRFVSTPTHRAITLTDPDTEYAVDLEPGTIHILVQARTNDLRLAYLAGKVADPAGVNFFTVKQGQRPYNRDYMTGIKRLYLASSFAGAVAEIEMWN